MAASRLDLRWDRRGDWVKTLRRRTRSGVVLPVVAPSVLEVRPTDAPSTSTPALVAASTIEDDGALTVRVTREQIATLGGSDWEYLVVVTDAATVRPLVLLRGYVLLIDNAGGP